MNAVLAKNVNHRVTLCELTGRPLPGAPSLTLSALWETWRMQFSLAPVPEHPAQPLQHIWAHCPGVAAALVHGVLPLECGALSLRTSTFMLEPLAKHEKLLHSYLKTHPKWPWPLRHDNVEHTLSLATTSADTVPKPMLHDTSAQARQAGSTSAYSCRHLVLAVRATQDLAALGRLESALESLLKFGVRPIHPTSSRN